MVLYNDGHFMGTDFAWNFMLDNEICLCNMIQDYFGDFDYNYMLYLCKERPYDVYRALKDFLDSPVEKHERAVNLFNEEGHVQLIFGARGSGKTATAFYFVEQVYKRKIFDEFCWVGLPNPNIPDWMRFYPTINDCPEGSFITVDESGIQHGSRNFSSKDNKELGSLLMIARHQEKSIQFITQYSASVDIEIVRQSSSSLIKKNAQFQSETDRDIFYSLVEYMKPQKLEDSLVVHNDDLFRITTGLPSFWSDSVSKFYRAYKDEEEALAIGFQYYKSGLPIDMIIKTLSIRGGFKFDKKELSDFFDKKLDSDKLTNK
jgi:hypothetical protein